MSVTVEVATGVAPDMSVLMTSVLATSMVTLIPHIGDPRETTFSFLIFLFRMLFIYFILTVCNSMQDRAIRARTSTPTFPKGY